MFCGWVCGGGGSTGYESEMWECDSLSVVCGQRQSSVLY
jgi:hypothetical protein